MFELMIIKDALDRMVFGLVTLGMMTTMIAWYSVSLHLE